MGDDDAIATLDVAVLVSTAVRYWNLGLACKRVVVDCDYGHCKRGD